MFLFDCKWRFVHKSHFSKWICIFKTCYWVPFKRIREQRVRPYLKDLHQNFVRKCILRFQRGIIDQARQIWVRLRKSRMKLIKYSLKGSLHWHIDFTWNSNYFYADYLGIDRILCLLRENHPTKHSHQSFRRCWLKTRK